MSNQPASKLTIFMKENFKKSNKELLDIAIKDFNYSYGPGSFSTYINRLRKKFKNIEVKEVQPQQDFIKLIQSRKIISLFELTKILHCDGTELIKLIDDYKTQGYHIIIDNDILHYGAYNINTGIIKPNQLEEKEIIFAAASDLHFGSKACQITALNEFCNECRKQGVKHIFSPGDVTAGRHVYPGQEFDLYELSAQGQTDSLLANLQTGFDWWILGGNHDYSHIKNGSYNPLNVMSSKRHDLHNLGYDECVVPILNGIDLQMWHPSGGVPYSISYRLQKGVEQLAFSELLSVSRGLKEKPSIKFVLCGHLHIQMQALFGSIFGMQCGAFEGVTNYLKRKGLVPAIGGYIVKANIKNNGILNFEAKFYLYPEIIDDWKNYSHSYNEEKIQLKPILEG